MRSHYKPWDIAPSLRLDRLRVVAGIIKKVWADLSVLHEPSDGDTAWSIGCRGYSRTCFAISCAASGEHKNWLRVLEDNGLSYLFAVGDVPFKFLRADPTRTVNRHRECRRVEADARQGILDLFPDPEVAGLLPRLVVETDGVWRLRRVVLLWLDSNGHSYHPFEIPLEDNVITPVTPPPVELPTAPLEFDEWKRARKDKAE